MRTVNSLALQILHANGTIAVEHDTDRQRMQLDLKPIGMARSDVEQALACSYPLMSIGAEWGEAEAVGIAPQQAPIIGI